MVLGILTCIHFIMFVILTIYYFLCKYESEVCYAIWVNTGIIFVITLVCLMIDREDRDRPQAIDVYKNKTTLKISYIDDVAVDTVVVYKGKYYK